MQQQEEDDMLSWQLRAAESAPMGVAAAGELDRQRHIAFHLYHCQGMPTPYQALEVNHNTMCYMALAALDSLGALQALPDRQAVIDHLYSLQVVPDPRAAKQLGGFRGGTFAGNPYNPEQRFVPLHPYDVGHIAMTYTSLAMLRMLGDSFERVNRAHVIALLRELQQPDGGFQCIPLGSEADMRFMYCACAISTFLDDWSGVDQERAVQYILRSQAYDGGFAQAPGLESHGSSVYLAIASLFLMGRLDALPDRDAVIRWCLQRQICGFQGRPNKPADSCYSFWIGGALQMLGAAHLIEADYLTAFNRSCESAKGGFAKWPQHKPDLVHSYMALAGLSIVQRAPLEAHYAPLGVTRRAAGALARALDSCC